MKNWSANTNSPEILTPQLSLVLILKDGEREEKAEEWHITQELHWNKCFGLMDPNFKFWVEIIISYFISLFIV